MNRFCYTFWLVPNEQCISYCSSLFQTVSFVVWKWHLLMEYSFTRGCDCEYFSIMYRLTYLSNAFLYLNTSDVVRHKCILAIHSEAKQANLTPSGYLLRFWLSLSMDVHCGTQLQFVLQWQCNNSFIFNTENCIRNTRVGSLYYITVTGI